MVRKLLTKAFLIFIATSALVWPALYNGQPFFFYDTSAYLRGADAGIQKITGIATSWSQIQESDDAAPNQALRTSKANAYPSLSSVKEKAVLAGRSVYYGALLYAGHMVGGSLWLSIGIQGLLVVLTLVLALRACNEITWPYIAIILVIACLTPAALFSSFLMPDIFAALTILACSVVMIAGSKHRWGELFFWLALLTFALLSHTSHILLAIAMLGLGVVINFCWPRRVATAGLYVISAALALAIAGEVAFSVGVTRLLGEPPIRPPFLMARSIADGPGYDYLRSTCPENGFAICKFIDRLPQTADQILWRRDSDRGIFGAADPQTRRNLSSEQFRFVLAVLRYDPLGQIVASIRNSFVQASSLAAADFEYFENDSYRYAEKLPADYWEKMQKTPAYLHTMPIGLFSFLSYFSAILGFFYLVYALVLSKNRKKLPLTHSEWLAVLVLSGVFANALICGVMSTPHDRYQARVIWLLPIVALIVDFEHRRTWWEGILAQIKMHPMP